MTTIHPDLQAELDMLRRENARLKASANSRHRMKVSEKGCLSIYGFGRFPISLFRDQWVGVLALKAEIEAFIEAHDKELPHKGD